jgi:hypothetical protein
MRRWNPLLAMVGNQAQTASAPWYQIGFVIKIFKKLPIIVRTHYLNIKEIGLAHSPELVQKLFCFIAATFLNGYDYISVVHY